MFNGSRVEGVVVETGRDTWRVYAGNVILATGGFAGKQELAVRYAPEVEGPADDDRRGLHR